MTRLAWGATMLILAAGCGGGRTPPHPATAQAIPQVSATETATMLERGEAILIDVRERDEVLEGMAAPAIWLPLSSINSNDDIWRRFLDTMRERPDMQVVAYCRSGRRSGLAAAELTARGYRAANMGGFSDWVAAGQPIKRPENPVPGM